MVQSLSQEMSVVAEDLVNEDVSDGVSDGGGRGVMRIEG